MGVEQVLSAYRSTWGSSYLKRIIGSLRRECLDRCIVFNEHRLRRVLTDCFDYYHRARAHMSLDRNSPVARDIEPQDAAA